MKTQSAAKLSLKPETWCLLLSLAKTLARLGLGEAMTSAYTDSEEEGVYSPFH